MSIKYTFLLSCSLLFLGFSMIAQVNLETTARNYITEQSGPFGELTLSAEDLIVSSAHRSKPSGTTNIYFQQKMNGIDIFNAVGSVHLNDDGNVLSATNGFVSTEDVVVRKTENINTNQALERTAAHFNLSIDTQTEIISLQTSDEKRHVLQNASLAFGNIQAKLVYVQSEGELKLAWDISFEKKDDHFWWNVRVDAATGEILEKNTWTVECNFDHLIGHEYQVDQGQKIKSMSYLEDEFVANSYNVYEFPLEAPNDGDRSIVTEPWNLAPNASPFGWHDMDGVPGADNTDTRGNNVFAQDDLDADNSGGSRPDGGEDLEFDFPIDLTMAPSTYLDAAIVNLFYANNYIHDVLYQYGFDEASGNFQYNNYGNGGLGMDPVDADAQDGSGTNNANFSTPPDGFRPRMQMFEWVISDGLANVEVTSPFIQTFEASKASFGDQSAVSIPGTLVMTDPADACTPLNNGFAINGNIALIDRGTCEFDFKVNAVEVAGAIAAVVCNNVAGNPITMGGDNNPPVTIASGMISLEDCDIIKGEMPGVEIVYNQFDPVIPNRDSDLDNGIIVHEYGHGVSNRLTGGPANTSCLFGQERMGEGWSDILALLFTLKSVDMPKDGRGIGSYVIGEPRETGQGIRPFPYSTDMNVNPHTYDSIKDPGLSEPHGVGSVWCVMLWEMTWNLIQKHGFDPDIYNGTKGNNIALQLILEGMKLQPCGPGFVDGRDAILLADTSLYNGANSCEIWRAFAKRGLGINAVQGTVNSRTDGTEDFTLPVGCELDPCTAVSIIYEDETIPDMTDVKVEDAVTMIGTVDIASPGATVTISAPWGLDILGEFTTPESSTFTLNRTPCDASGLARPIKSKSPKKDYQSEEK